MDYKTVIAQYKDTQGGIIEAFHAVQAELSYLPEEVIAEAAKVFGMPVSEAYGVATFYSMFSTEPRGKNIIRICESAPCHIAGAPDVIAALERELGIEMGESTPDGLFALEFTECVGQCQATPVITINGEVFYDVSPAKVPGILAKFQK